MSDIVISKVETSSDKKQFIKFLWTVYANDPNWVPPLWMDRRKLMDKEKNPFYRHSDAEFYLARRNGTVVGRIAAIVNHNHIKEHNEDLGFFGFFECIDDQAVANALFDTAAAFLRSKKMKVMRGPVTPSVNDEIGLLVEGYDRPPVVLMTYNPRYYETLITNYGLRKVKDLYAYYLEGHKVFNPKMERVNKLLRERNSFTIRSMNMKKFEQEVALIKEVYNSAWSRNWGAVPMTNEEMDALAADLKPVVVPELVLFLEHKGKPIGFSLSIPDINLALIHNKRGWLLPGLFHIMRYKKKIHLVRVITLGVIPEYQNSGAGALLLYETGRRGVDLGYPMGEASWVLEDNIPMVRAAEAMQGDLYKKYRLFDIAL